MKKVLFLLLLGTFIVVVLYGIGELRLFGKSFEDKKRRKII